MHRRQLLKATGASMALPLLRPFDAQAKAEQLVIMTWGGQWGDAMRDNVDAAYTKTTGIKVVQDHWKQFEREDGNVVISVKRAADGVSLALEQSDLPIQQYEGNYTPLE